MCKFERALEAIKELGKELSVSEMTDFEIAALGLVKAALHKNAYVQAYHPCGHKCYPGRTPEHWCIECKYGPNPYH